MGKEGCQMLSFENDYSAGAHSAVLRRLMETNLDPQPGYGNDIYCAAAKEKIRRAFSCPNGEVFFLVGGTQTNALVIDTALQPFEGVMTADSGHINGHECGAVEFTGHKIFPLPHKDGKVSAAAVQERLQRYENDAAKEHGIKPGMLYISHPTEYGTLYTKEELTALSRICRKAGVLLYLDGARLGYGLMSRDTDLTPADIAALCDAFYIGGTKVGALCGEALVFSPGKMPPYFFSQVKQHGALLAKGRLLGVQFDALFTDDLYWHISRHAITMADELKALFRRKGYTLALETPTNQQFILMEDSQVEALAARIRFSRWEKPDATHTVVRFCTSWATTDEDIAALASIL